MYLTKLVLQNSGAISNLLITANPSGARIEPIVVIGKNGAGKTNLLSHTTDALIEIADEMFQDIRPSQAVIKQYFRVLGGITRRSGSNYELAVIEFSSNTGDVSYVAKAGTVPDDILSEVATRSVPKLPDPNSKAIKFEGSKPSEEFQAGVHIYFPASRSESAYWQNDAFPSAEIIGERAYTNRLGKSLVSEKNRQSLKSWIATVIFDLMIDVNEFLNAIVSNPSVLASAVETKNRWTECNSLLSAVVQQPARFVKVDRQSGADIVQIRLDQDDQQIAFEALSSGQNHLLLCFLEILRQGDARRHQAITDIEGIVVIDEADAHLHIHLQADVLPKLMLLFPKVQFILSLHSPFAILGIDRAYSGSYQLVEVPSGQIVTAERYSEFVDALKYVGETSAFEKLVVEYAGRSEKVLVLCEGQTDPAYLSAAASYLGQDDLLNSVVLDWVGTLENGKAKDGGEARLQQAVTAVRNNPTLARAGVVAVFDLDTNVMEGCQNRVQVLRLEDSGNKVCRSGIENLLPESAFAPEFYQVEERRTADITIIKKLKKDALCRAVCSQPEYQHYLRSFGPTLDRLKAAVAAVKS